MYTGDKLMKHFNTHWLGLFALGALSLAQSGCKTDINALVNGADAGIVGSVATGLAEQCGLTCPADGILKGNAAISGVASVDAFFGAVVNYQAASDNVSTGIEAQLDDIRADFGLASDANLKTELAARIAANLDGALTVQAEPASCVADVETAVKAAASCDATIDPGKAAVTCKGTCTATASASASCESSSTLKCTMAAPSITCAGECQGSCTETFAAAASCTGVCEGTCTGTCSSYLQDAAGVLSCNGQCDAMCTGSCSSEFAVSAKCNGSCDGQCTLTDSSASCTGSVRTSCAAKANATVTCDGQCDGEIQPPVAKAECQASASAQAKINVRCTPPHLAMHYKLAAVAAADVTAQIRFVTALELLRIKLPVLLASLKRSESITSAGSLLTSSATGAVKSSFELAVKGKITVKETIGLGCALGQLDDVNKAISSSSERLSADVASAADLKAAVGLTI
jgi:hypothetical protein